ncbi:MAG: FmdB family transcriptional regulator [Opitutaceae bacterium]|nr:FmdB family transcriptional regulator [Opitutaceae bacterium]
MPIYEYYCPVHHTVYQFYAKTLAQGRTTPRCPDDPAHTLVKLLSSFAVTSAGNRGEPPAADNDGAAEDPRMEAAMGAMEREFSHVDENDPRAMARMMRRMAELTGEPIDGQMEEVVRKLEEGADPDSLEEELGGEPPCSMPDPDAPPAGAAGSAPRQRFRSRRLPPRRDPQLHDYQT